MAAPFFVGAIRAVEVWTMEAFALVACGVFVGLFAAYLIVGVFWSRVWRGEF